MSAHVCGLDVHKRYTYATILGSDVGIVAQGKMGKTLAELLRVNCLPESYFPPPEIALLREKVWRRAFMVKQQTKLKVKVHSVLTYEGIELPQATASSPRMARNGWRGWAWSP